MAIDIYRDFVLVADHVQTKANGSVDTFEVQVFDSPAGQGEYKEIVTVPEGLQDEIGFLSSRSSDYDKDIRAQMTLGAKLAGLLLPEYARQLYNVSLARLGVGQGLRLWLRLADELTDFPWEYMLIQIARGEYSPSSFLALDPRISIVRHLPLAKPADWFEAGDRFNAPESRRLVVAMATPKPYDDYPLLANLPAEQKGLKERLEKVPGLKTVFLPEYNGHQADELTGATMKKIVDALSEHTDIFHFSGHGDLSGALALANENNQILPVNPDRFAESLQGSGVRLVVLGACETGRRDGRNVWTGTAAALLKVGIPAVLAMQFAIYSDLAQAFMEAFYQSLVIGDPIDTAVAQGRKAIRLATIGNDDHLSDWGIPVLYMRAPSGAVFNPVSDPKSVGAARQAVDHLVMQDVGEVSETGLVKGVEIGVMKSDRVRVQQSGEDVKGVLIGGEVYRVEGGHLVIDQKFGTVSGSVTGLRIGTLGGSPQPQQDEDKLIAKIEDWYRQRPEEEPPATETTVPESVETEAKNFNPSEAAAYLGFGFTEAAVIAAIEAGDLKARKLGPTYIVRKRDLDELLE